MLSGKAVPLEVDEAALRADVRLLVDYFENFGGFFGDALRLQRDYFMFMSWLFAAPFVCDLRNRALGQGGYVFDYPLFAVLFGKRNCGKTRLIETLLRAMFGHARFLNKDDFTRTNLRGLLASSKRFPAVFDVEKKRFDLHAGDVIKDELFMLPEYPAFVLSMNADNHAFSTESRKRCLMVCQSQWIARLIEARLARTWPAPVRALAGAWPDLPETEELRQGQGEDILREAL